VPAVVASRLNITSSAVASVALLIVSNAAAQQSDDRLQDRYKLCMEKADAGFLEEFRGECDSLCIRQKREPASCTSINPVFHLDPPCCIAHHLEWDTANCVLPVSEQDRQDQHLEKAKDRCLAGTGLRISWFPVSDGFSDLEETPAGRCFGSRNRGGAKIMDPGAQSRPVAAAHRRGKAAVRTNRQGCVHSVRAAHPSDAAEAGAIARMRQGQPRGQLLA
jgi:hypothetical protein